MNLDVIHNGKFVYSLNRNLIVKNKVTEESRKKLKITCSKNLKYLI